MGYAMSAGYSSDIGVESQYMSWVQVEINAHATILASSSSALRDGCCTREAVTNVSCWGDLRLFC